MLIEDKEGMVKKITESIQETLSERLSDQASDELAKKIAAKEKLLVKAVKNAQTADDLILNKNRKSVHCKWLTLSIRTKDFKHSGEWLKIKEISPDLMAICSARL